MMIVPAGNLIITIVELIIMFIILFLVSWLISRKLKKNIQVLAGLVKVFVICVFVTIQKGVQ